MAARLVTIAGVLFLAALFLPALALVDKPLFSGRAPEPLLYGIHCLLLCWVVGPAALANAMLFTAVLMHAFGGERWGHYAVSACVALVGFAAAIVTPYTLGASLRYPHVGYFAWVASIATLATASAVRGRELARRSEKPRGPRED